MRHFRVHTGARVNTKKHQGDRGTTDAVADASEEARPWAID
jgi:hypothetical protein